MPKWPMVALLTWVLFICGQEENVGMHQGLRGHLVKGMTVMIACTLGHSWLLRCDAMPTSCCSQNSAHVVQRTSSSISLIFCKTDILASV